SVGVAPYEVLYGRPCRSSLCWAKPEEHVTLRLELIEETIEKIKDIQERLKEIQSSQKSYADPKRREVEFDTGDSVFLKVTPRRGVTRFRVKGKLALRYIGPFEITERIGLVAYHLNLLAQLGHMHNVFHVSILKKHMLDPSHVVQYVHVPIQEDVSYEEQPIRLLA
ncbi:hypothetical protein PanWU01x14_316450, partial [Parasponia andersonii]